MPSFLLFLAASIAITVAPGPDNLQVLARGISQGRAAGLVAALGFSAGVMFHTTRGPQPLATIFRQSVIGNLLNPKVTLFFVVFLPQFVDTHGAQPVSLQMLELGVLFMLQSAVVFSAFGLGAGVLGAWLKRRPRAGVWLDRLAGATFIGLGLRIAFKD